MDKPLVSILMNCYNGEQYLGETLNCVINQTYKNWELIFWDNQSNDNSAQIFKSYRDKRFKYFYADQHTGLGEARSKAFKYLVGDFIAVLDTDDLWFPEKLEKQIILFDDKDVGIVISNSYFFNNYKKKKLYKKDPPSGWVADKIIPKYYVSLETLMFRSSYVKLINGSFDKRYDLIADFDLVVRLSKISKLAYVSDVLAACRIHDESDTFKNPKKFVDEKELWFKDQKQKNFFVDNKIVLKNFENYLLFYKAIFELIQFQKLKSLKLLLRIKPKKIKDYMLICFIFLPYSSLLMAKLLNRKMKFGL